MAHRPVLIAAGLAVLALAALAAVFGSGLLGGKTRSALDATDPEKVALGARLYAEHCAACHGAELEGQPDWRQRRADGRLPAPPHDASGHTWHHPPEQLFALTKFGPAALIGDGYQSAMPAYEGVLSDAEIWAVLSYLKSRWPAEVQARYDQMSQ
jgi:mono/diheme cytochrome c family protein